MRRTLTPVEIVERQLEELYHLYRVDSREIQELCEEQGLPAKGAKYHEACMKVWKNDYATRVNALNDKLAKMKKEGA